MAADAEAVEREAVERGTVEDGVEEEEEEEEDAPVESMTAVLVGMRMWEVYDWVVEAAVW